MNKTEQETSFSEKTIKFILYIVYKFFGPFNRPRRLLKGWHLFPFHSVETKLNLMEKFIGTDTAGVELFFNIFTSGISHTLGPTFVSLCAEK